jgi:hypothetical protein
MLMPKPIKIHFRSMEDFYSLGLLLHQPFYNGTKAIWYLPSVSTLPTDRQGEGRSAAFVTDMFKGVTEWKYPEWRGMPEFTINNRKPIKSITVHFKCSDDRQAFGNLLGQKLTDTKPIWYPKAQIKWVKSMRWVAGPPVNPRYPVYVISLNRWQPKRRLTSKALDRMGVPYRIVVEPHEYDKYAAVIDDPAKIIKAPENFSKRRPRPGSIPVRNFVWEHAISLGTKRHWILDDNIRGFYRLSENLRIPVATGAIFKAMEDFVDRYDNIAVAGPNYFMFAPDRTPWPPLDWNTRVYSCILIRNDLTWRGKPMRWRGRYNEDTDLSLRAMKDGWCTALFYAFLAQKMKTGGPGGNTDTIYQNWLEDRLAMAESLVDQHPDVASITCKWDRAQHQVTYRRFKETNKPVLKPDVVIPEAVNEYGMKIEQRNSRKK